MASRYFPEKNWIYVIRETGSPLNAVKIGVANNPERRLASMQCGNPRALELVDTIFIGSNSRVHAVERYIQRRLADLRIRGEWFAVSPEEAPAVVNDLVREFA